LAWEPADHKVYWFGIKQCRNVIIDRDARIVRRKNAALPRIQFALPRNRHASSLEAHVCAANASERATYAHDE
jgi:hypothetical protein